MLKENREVHTGIARLDRQITSPPRTRLSYAPTLHFMCEIADCTTSDDAVAARRRCGYARLCLQRRRRRFHEETFDLPHSLLDLSSTTLESVQEPEEAE